MIFKVEYNPDFYNDIIEAVEWYNFKQSGLGDRFFEIVKKQTLQLSKSALHFAIKYDNIRCFCIEKFPYLVHYRVDELSMTVKVEALIHTSRNTKITNKRL